MIQTQALFALFVRSLREEKRRILPYAGRVCLVLILLFFITLIKQQFRYGGGAAGLRVFETITYLNFVFITVIGMSYFGSVITEEKEDGTLGLLRMTNLNPISILLGKSVSRLLGALLLILTQIPFTLLAVTLGGVSTAQVYTVYAVLLGFTFMLSNLALFFSVVCRRTPLAISWTVLVLVLMLCGFWFIGNFLMNWLGTSFGLNTLASWCWEANPVNPLQQVFRTGFQEIIVKQLVLNVVLGIIFFGLAWVLFDVFNQGEGRGASSGGGRRLAWRRPGATIFAKPRPGNWAVLWREFYYHLGGFARMFLTLVLVVLFVWAIYGYNAVMFGRHRSLDLDDLAEVLIPIGIILFLLRLSTGAASIFKHERRAETLSSLALLPRPLSVSAYEKVFAVLVAALPGALIAILGVILWDDLQMRSMLRDDDFYLAMFYATSLVVFGLHLIAWLSLYLRWGALPIGIAGTFLINLMMLMMMAFSGVRGDPDGFIVLFSLVFYGCSVIVHVMIGNRLNVVAAEA